MAAPNTPVNLNKTQQEAVTKYVINCVESLGTVWNLREQFLSRDLLYYRETDLSQEQTRAAAANYGGDPYKLQNMVTPVVLPQVESAVAYLGGVFLTGYPIFGVASNPQNMDAALQMETVIADNAIRYGWQRELLMFFRDALKYNFAAIELSWKKQRTYSLVDDPASGAAKKTEVLYEGNCIRRLDPYNLIWDKRILNPSKLHIEGEFAGWTEIMTRIQLKQLLLDLNSELTMNGKEAFESGQPTVTLNGSDSWFFIPQVNKSAFLGTATSYPTTNWLAWAMLGADSVDQGIKYNNIYEVTTLYGRIIPADFRMTVQQRNQPQIWKFIVVNRNTLVFVERQTNAHNLLPILVAQPNDDGLGYQTKSFVDNVAPFQQMSTSLWNSVLESKRRRVYDRIFYDPSRVRKEDIDRVTSVARIPVKQSAYGKPLSEAVYAFPYRDDQSAADLQLAQSLYEMADIANGQNKVQRGQFQKGNKTKTEFMDTMQNSSNRQQMQALVFENQVFIPLKEMIKLNILQYQPKTTVYNSEEKQAVEVNPQTLRSTAMQFKISDGLLPTDKMLSTDLLQVFMQTIQTSPLMQAEFDMVGAFAYWCKTQGAQWFEDFRRSPEDRQAVMNQLAGMEAAGKSPAARPQNQQGA